MRAGSGDLLFELSNRIPKVLFGEFKTLDASGLYGDIGLKGIDMGH